MCTITMFCADLPALLACLLRHRGRVERVIQRPDGAVLVSVAVAEEEA